MQRPNSFHFSLQKALNFLCELRSRLNFDEFYYLPGKPYIYRSLAPGAGVALASTKFPVAVATHAQTALAEA